MKVWRLKPHHKNQIEALQLMEERNCIAIGASNLGDIRKLKPETGKELSTELRRLNKHRTNLATIAPSLWNLYANMDIGDLVIVKAKPKVKTVFEVVGPYYFEGKKDLLGYKHQRKAVPVDIDADELWESCGAGFAKGQSQRWTLALCDGDITLQNRVFKEGERFSVVSTKIERNAKARAACLKAHDYDCAVCGFNFEKEFGAIGKGYIHVHHIENIASKKGVYEIDPVNDLVPLCPNCHAMAHHKSKVARSVEELKKLKKK